MTTFTVPYGDDSDSGSSPSTPRDPRPGSPQLPDSPTPLPKALCVAKSCKSLPKDASYRPESSQPSNQDRKGRHVSKTGDETCEVSEKVMADIVNLDLSNSTRATANNNSKPNKDGRSLSEIINAPWSDDDDDDYMVAPAMNLPYDPKTPSPQNATSLLPAPSGADIVSNVSSPSLKPSLAMRHKHKIPPAAIFTCQAQKCYMDICSPNDFFFEDHDCDNKSKNQSLNSSQGRASFPSHLSRGSGQVVPGKENEEGMIIDEALVNLFNCSDLLDYQQYLWRIEGGLTSETRRDSTMIMEGRSVKQVSFDYYRQSNPFRDVPETKRFIIIHRLPLPSPDQRFYGNAYLLGCDASSKILFARRFGLGCPNERTELPLVWETGTEVFRISVDHPVMMLADSLVGDEVVHLPRLIGSEYCLVDGYKEWLGMEVIVLVRFAQWVIDFAEPLFQEDEDEIMDMLATVERAADQLRVVVCRGSSDAWRAYDNGLNRMEYGQKLLANNENVTSLYTLSNRGCFSREFLAGSIPRPKRGSDKDREWLGRYGRRQSTEQGIERVGKRMAGLFDRPQTPPLPPNPFATLRPVLSRPSVSSVSTAAQAILPRLGEGPESSRKSLGPVANRCIARSPPRQASLLNSLTSNHTPTKDDARPLTRLRPRLKTPAITEEGFDEDPLQKAVLRHTGEACLASLVNGLWKVVANEPKLDNTLTRQKVAKVLGELREQASAGKLREDSQSVTSKDVGISGGPLQAEETDVGQKGERKSRFQFMRKWL